MASSRTPTIIPTLLAFSVLAVCTYQPVFAIKELTVQNYAFDLRHSKTLVTPVPIIPANETFPARLARAFSTRKIKVAISEGAVYVDIWPTNPEDKHCIKEVSIPASCNETDSNSTCPQVAAVVAPTPIICDTSSSPCVFDVNPSLVHCVRLQNAINEVKAKGEANTSTHTEFYGVLAFFVLLCVFKVARHARTAPVVRKVWSWANVAYFGLIFYATKQVFNGAYLLRQHTNIKYVDVALKGIAVLIFGLGVFTPVWARWKPHRGGLGRLDLGQACGYAIVVQLALAAVKWWSVQAQYVVVASVLAVALVFYTPRRLWNIIINKLNPAQDITYSEYDRMIEKANADPDAFLAKFPGKSVQWLVDNHPKNLKERFEAADRTTVPTYPEQARPTRRAQTQTAQRVAAPAQ